MSIAKSIGKKKKLSGDLTAWDTAITDAKQRIKELRHSIKVFQRHKDAGDNWPGIKKSGNG